MRKTNLSLEGLRGAAAVFVVLFHMHFSLPGLDVTRNGYLAVDLFFVLSGFVIANAYSARIDNPNQLTSFIVRRFGRLWPTHMTASVLCYLVPNAIYAALTSMHADIPQPTLPTVGEVLGIVFMTQGLHLFDHDIGTAVSWSSSDEFYVYLMFGVVCLAEPPAHRRFHRPRPDGICDRDLVIAELAALHRAPPLP
ncbi:acyltransferase family protein [Burkholderia ubonensis]|uniref:acyltransferase family protein n=1 Tax=Burkholderia ubonensis TaxID=101571 RepID=UPI0035900DB4